MFNIKLLVVSFLMVAGNLFASNSFAEDTKFFNYRNGSFVNRLVDQSFGWFKTLDNEQKEAYYGSIIHAVMYADNGQPVRWYRNDASGEATAVMTWPTGAGYCRRIHVQTIAFNVEKIMAATACYDDINNRWQWV